MKRVFIKTAALAAAILLIACRIPAFASEGITLDIFAYSKDNSRTYIAQNIEVEYIASPLELLKKYCTINDIKYNAEGAYLKSIADYKAGGNSGWLHQINGKDPGVSAAAETLKPGDKLVWFFAVTKQQWSGTVTAEPVSSAVASSPSSAAPASSAAGTSSVNPESRSASSSQLFSSTYCPSFPDESSTAPDISSSVTDKTPAGEVLTGLYKEKYDKIKENQIEYLQKNPGTWTAFALGSFGQEIPRAVMKDIEAAVKNAAEISSVLECQRLYFNARAAGLDTARVYKKAVDESKIEASTLNALIFGARVKYAESGGKALLTEKQKEYFFSVQKEDGSFALTEDFDGDIDITAMAAATLFLGNDELKAAAARATGWLKTQAPEYSESAAQMLIAGVTVGDRELCETALAALLQYENADGGFAHKAGHESDPTATEQAMIALSSLKYEVNPYTTSVGFTYCPPADYSRPWIAAAGALLIITGAAVFIILRIIKRKRGSAS